jgi:predicted amidohydrolase YtcJ
MDPNPLDLLLTGGSVYAVDRERSVAEAVGIKAGRIAAVGSAGELAGHAGASTRVIELEGRTVLPGFQDAHLHPLDGGLLAIVCNLHETESAEECFQVIARYAGEHPEREWITGDGWSMDFFPGGNPDKDRLDEVVGDRPVYLENRDGHTAWVNSRALELASIGAGTQTRQTDGSSVRATVSRAEPCTRGPCASSRSWFRPRPSPTGSTRS